MTGYGPDVDDKWTAASYAYDTIESFFGGDPESAPAYVSNFAGGMLAVGDAGSIIKNLYRFAGFSKKDPNWYEVTLSTAGLATESLDIWAGAGEVPDVPISIARAVVASIGYFPLAQFLMDEITLDFIESANQVPDAIYAKLADLENFVRDAVKNGIDPALIPQSLQALTPGIRKPLSDNSARSSSPLPAIEPIEAGLARLSTRRSSSSNSSISMLSLATSSAAPLPRHIKRPTTLSSS